MDRFLDSANPEKRLRSKDIQTQLNTSRDRVQRLTQGKVCRMIYRIITIVTHTT